jgi:hypothetical protein
MTRAAIAALAVFALIGCGASPERGRELPLDEEPDPQALPKELPVVLPPFPKDADLVEFRAGPSGSHRYFIDSQSLSIGTDGIVRYVVVIRAAGGAVNVSFEGQRCARAQKRLFAVGRQGNQWITAKHSDWLPIDFSISTEYQAVLYRTALCPHKVPARSRQEAVRALTTGESGLFPN